MFESREKPAVLPLDLVDSTNIFARSEITSPSGGIYVCVCVCHSVWCSTVSEWVCGMREDLCVRVCGSLGAGVWVCVCV